MGVGKKQSPFVCLLYLSQTRGMRAEHKKQITKTEREKRVAKKLRWSSNESAECLRQDATGFSEGELNFRPNNPRLLSASSFSHLASHCLLTARFDFLFICSGCVDFGSLERARCDG